MNNSNERNGFSRLLKKIKSSNHNKKIKLRYRPTDQKGYSLYLDLWKNGRRQYEFLSLYLEGKTTTLQNDNEILRLAFSMRSKRNRAA